MYLVTLTDFVFIILSKFSNFKQISNFLSNFKILSKFRGINQISEIQPNFGISAEQNFNQMSALIGAHVQSSAQLWSSL